MKNVSTARNIRHSILSIAAVAAVSLPLMASAATGDNDDPNRSLLVDNGNPAVQNDPEQLYGKLKSQSHEVCGSSSLRIAGDIRRSRQVKDCYEGTLTAAVQRLDNPEVSELHDN